MISPCCGSSLQQGTKFLAMLSMTLSVIGMAISSVTLFSFLVGSKPKDHSAEEEAEDPTTIGIKYFVSLLLCIFNLFLGILLLIGAEQRNLRLCMVWFKVAIALLLMDLLWLTVSLSLGIDGVGDTVVNVCGIFYSFYELWVVLAFTSEIRSQKEAVLGCHTVSTTMTV